MSTSARIAGRYRLTERVGAGGMGVLWAGHDEVSGQNVAVRILERGLDEAARVAHFRASARAAARVQHPGIARVLDEGQEQDQPYIVTEWIDGWPLSAWRTARAPWGFLRPLLVQLCDALAHIHAAGLVHLDLRPPNVLVSHGPDGPCVRLVDIGCARIDDGWSDRPVGARATLKHLGSLRYMAPEVADSPPWMVGPWSDLYSVGLVIWELLAGSVPFADKHGVGLLLQRASEPVPLLPPDAGAPYHETLSNLVFRLLARDPADRPRSAAQVKRTLEALEAPAEWVEPPRLPAVRQASFDHAAGRAGAFPLQCLEPGPLVGRAREWQQADLAVQEVVAGYGSRVMVIEGPVAVGKSRFVQEVVEAAESRGSARCWRVSYRPGAAPGSGLVGALEDLLRAAATDADGVAARARALPLLLGVESDGMEAVLPALLRPDPTPFTRTGADPDPGVEVGSVGSAHMVAGTFFELLRRAARYDAVVLWLDDLHWSTFPEGIDLIRRILAAPEMSVCVLATVARDQPGVEGVHTALPAGDRVRWMRLDPLDDDAVRTYVRARLNVDPATETRVAEAIARHPLMLRGVTDLLLAGRLVSSPGGNRLAPGTLLPETLSELFSQQNAELPSGADSALVPDLVVGLAHARLPLTPRVLRALHSVDEHRPIDLALAAAERARLMVRSPWGRWRFTHGMVQDWLVLHARDRSASWHRRWLKALETLEGAGRGRLGIERAAHAEALGDTPAALRALQAAAGWALGPGQQALERGMMAAQRAESLATANGDVAAAGRAIRLRAELLRQAGRADNARQALTAAEATLGTGHTVERGWIALTWAWLELDAQRRDAAVERFHAAQALFEEARDTGGVVWTWIGLGTAARLAGEHRLARTLGRQAEERFTELKASRGVLAARYLRASAADAAGDFAKAERRYARLQVLADQRRWLLEATTLRLHRARIALEMRRAHDALVLLDEADSIAGLVRLHRLQEWVHAVRPAALGAAGDYAGARAAFNGVLFPTPRLCRLASQAVQAALRNPTTALDERLHAGMKEWAGRLAEVTLRS